MATYKNLRKVLNLPTLSASPSSGVNGEMYFNTTDSALFIYDGAWKKVTQSAIPGPDWTATTQQAILQASDAEASDKFGYSVGIDGDTLIVGAFLEDTAGTNAGAAYVFTRSGTSWSQQAKLQSSDIEAVDVFGSSVAIDGDTVVVGARAEDTGGTDAGSAYIFTRSGTSWSQQAKLQSSDIQAGDIFGSSVTIEGDTVVVGAYLEDTGGTSAGAAYVFTRSGTSWSQQAKIQSSDIAAGDNFGRYSLHLNSNTLVVGAHNENKTGAIDGAGSAYVFTRSGTSWSQQAKLVASDASQGSSFGQSVAIDGDTIVVGAHKESTVVVNGGAAYIFTRSGTTWSQQARIISSDVTAWPAAGSVTNSLGYASEFGFQVSIEGDTVIVAAPKNNEETYPGDGYHAGAGYIFTRSGTSWTEVEKLTASNWDDGTGTGTLRLAIGQSLAMSNKTVVLCSTRARDPVSNAYDAGAAYTFLAG